MRLATRKVYMIMRAGGLLLLLFVSTVLVACNDGAGAPVQFTQVSQEFTTSTPLPTSAPTIVEPGVTSEAASSPVSTPIVPLASDTVIASPSPPGAATTRQPAAATSIPVPAVAPVTTIPTGDQITRVEPGQGEVALVFNADWFVGEISTILNTLSARNTRLTFFLTGGYLDRFPGQVRAIEAAGQEIASHGYEHLDFRELTNEQALGQIDRWQETFSALTGRTGPAFWMAPSGYSNSRIRQAAIEHGYPTIYWTLDTLDAVGDPKSKEFVLNRVLNTSQVSLDGAIILMHMDKVGTVDALPEILDALDKRGLRAVTISELLRK